MKTDAMLFSLSSGNEVQKSRMDRLQDTGRRASAMEFGSSKGAKSRFEDTYRQVARNNAVAQRETDKSIDSRDARSFRVQDEQKLREPEHIERVTANRVNEISDRQAPATKKEQDEAQASDVIRESLREISEELQLDIAPGLEDLSFSNVSDDTIKQFAEIIHALKQITSALEMAVSQNQSIQTDSAVIDPQKAGEMAQMLKTELFKIEIGLNSLGVTERVQAQVALQMDLPFDAGIPQATNPNDLIMPAEQIKKLFGNLIDESQQSINSLAKKAAELLDQNASGKSTPVNVQIIPENKVGALTTFDSQTYRAMLKLEVKEQTVHQNVIASGNEKPNVPGLLEPAITNKVTSLDSEMEIFSISETSGKSLSATKNNPLFEAKMTGTYKSLEESVMNQISSKLSNVVRSGATEVKIQLWPESLGEVKLRIRVEGDVVVAKIQVENQQVKQIVESNLQSLKDSLAEHNLAAGAFDVNVGDGKGKQTDEAGDESWGSRQKVSGVPVGNGSSIDDVALSSQLETGRRYGSNTVEYFG